MRLIGWVCLAIGLSACQAPRDGCGLIGCVSSPYLRARGQNLIGASISTAIATMGGAPTSTYDINPTTKVATWTRQQSDPSFGFLSCSETLTFNDGAVVNYARNGNCGSY